MHNPCSVVCNPYSAVCNPCSVVCNPCCVIGINTEGMRDAFSCIKIQSCMRNACLFVCSTVREEISRITFLPSLHRHSHCSSSPANKSVTGDGGAGSDSGEGCVEGRYVSVCRDGTLCFWKSNLTLQRMITVSGSILTSLIMCAYIHHVS